ncbi:MAG TPA: alpha/beta fold hydrolase, partial [Gammaproteobacteria bacterium]|nr:alpha/beta fold hydrolase [Gammaproteobacteria bacterium]
PGPAGRLEALIEEPALDRPPAGVAVLCHPHPLHGGTLQNKVVHTLARTCNALGLVAVRFNFRGVGASDGAYAETVGETEDLLAVLDWAQQQWPDLPLWLGGFSFGAYVALRAADRSPVQQLITVAPAVNLFAKDPLPEVQCDWLLVQGDQDEIVPYAQVMEWVASLERRPRILELSGAGHFFHGRLNELRERLLVMLG